MESNNENKQDVMVSNLPLLFSDGNPTNIDHMSAVIEKKKKENVIINAYYLNWLKS